MKPEDLPDDIWETAQAVAIGVGAGLAIGAYETIARAILAERARCAKVADEHAKAKWRGDNQVVRVTAESIADRIRNPSPIAAEGEEELRHLRAECDRQCIQYDPTDDADRLRERLNG